MKKISDEHARILQRRAVEAAEALVEAEIEHENGKIDDYFYISFKRYFYVRTHLDKLTALTNVDFQISQDEQHLKTYMLAATKSLAEENQIDMEMLKKLLVEGAFFIYAFRFNDLQPAGVVAHYPQGNDWISVSGVIKDFASQGYGQVLEKALVVCENMKVIDSFTYF